MSSITGQIAVNQTLKLLAVLQPGENPNTSESNDALVVINNVLDNWQIQRLQNVNVDQVSVSLTGGTQEYTLSPRPYAIYACTFVSVAFGKNVTYPVKMLTAVEWGNIVDRDVEANIVKGAFYDRDL